MYGGHDKNWWDLREIKGTEEMGVVCFMQFLAGANKWCHEVKSMVTNYNNATKIDGAKTMYNKRIQLRYQERKAALKKWWVS